MWSCAGFLLAQAKTLYFACCCFWKLVDELDPAWILEGRQVFFDIRLQRRSDFVAGLVFGAQDHVCRGLGQAVGARGADDGRSEAHTSELQSLMRTSYAVF